MRNWLAAAVLGVVCGSAPQAKAQEASTSRNETVQPGIPALSKGTWELDVFGGGGVVGSHSPDTEFHVVGGRLGRILTTDHLPGWLRGNFEIAGCDVVHTSNANLGKTNLGYAYSFIATVGYTFFGRPGESH
jgi:hypothetical protein